MTLSAKHRRRAFSVCAVTALTLALLSSTALASNEVHRSTAAEVAAWYKATGGPIADGMLVGYKLVGQEGNYLVGCKDLERLGTQALGKPYPPDASLAYHWGAAMGLSEAAGAECAQSFARKDAPGAEVALGYLQDGYDQFADAMARIKALTGTT